MSKIVTLILTIIISMYSFMVTNVAYKETPNMEERITRADLVSANGWLHTEGAKLLNEKNQPIQLTGLSSHGIEWFGNLVTYNNLQTLKEDWKTNIFRIAMYTDESGQGYVFNKQADINEVYRIADMAISLDMYVIIDWHILQDNNPQKHKSEAIEFFDTVSKKYGNCANVIYEICNEPNGSTSWDSDVKPYAEEVIPVIRKNSPKSLIIVGTPFWCQHIDKAADNPLNFSNIVYSCHFYAGSHKQELRDKIDYCISKNIPIFVSECGATTADGNGSIYNEEFTTWINYLNSKKISWLYWSFCNKNEGSAVLKPEYNTNMNINDYLTTSGEFIKNILVNK